MLRQLCSGKISFIELIPWDYSVKLFFFAFHTQMAKNCRIFQVKVEHLAAIITNTMLTKDLWSFMEWYDNDGVQQRV